MGFYEVMGRFIRPITVTFGVKKRAVLSAKQSV